MPDRLAERPPAPPTQCSSTPDGHVHLVGDADGGCSLVCCHDSERTYPLAYRAGRVERHRDKVDVVQCRTDGELRTTATVHKTATHPGTVAPKAR